MPHGRFSNFSSGSFAEAVRSDTKGKASVTQPGQGSAAGRDKGKALQETPSQNSGSGHAASSGRHPSCLGGGGGFMADTRHAPPQLPQKLSWRMR
jgi:hypothetical protein